MKTAYYPFLIIILLFFACGGNLKDAMSKDTVIPIHTIKWKNTKDFPIETLVKDIVYIPFEEKEAALFSNIDKIIIKNNRIYILNTISGTDVVLVFDMTGTFLYQVGKQGLGPGEYIARPTIDFEVLENGEVVIFDQNSRNVLYYDANGKYLKTIKARFSIDNFRVLPNGEFLLATNTFEANNQNNKAVVTKDFQTAEKRFLHHLPDKGQTRIGNLRLFQLYMDSIDAYFPISDTLYVFDKSGTLSNSYFFDFGNRRVPADLKYNVEKLLNVQQQGASYISIVDTPIRLKNYLFVRLQMGNRQAIAVFNEKQGTSTYEELTPENFSVNHINVPLTSIGDSIIVSAISPNKLYTKAKNRIPVPEIDQFVMNGGFVLCLYKIKFP